MAELNRVRASLRALAKNHTAFGLKQPHLQRTKLCELADDQLEPLYVEQRATLRAFVAAEARAKIAPRAILARGESGGGADDARAADGSAAAMTGPALAALVERSVNALNEGDFPSAPADSDIIWVLARESGQIWVGWNVQTCLIQDRIS